MNPLVVLDNEAIQALASPHHPKHQSTVNHVQLLVRRKKRTTAITLVAPTAVRVEAGWDRASPQWAFLNRLPIADAHLDEGSANKAAAIREQAQVSVADAHIGATVQSAPHLDITVLTSDPKDIRKVVGGRPVKIIRI
jgi:predicted nucleic acid-binding protein